MADGARMDKGTNNLFATFNKIAPTATWEQVFTDQLNRWASASNGKVEFDLHSDNGQAFNYAGAAQNDSGSGDIRIGAHRFDGTNKVLAHTYYPPPNGRTAAGDSHYDSAEAWVLDGSGLLSGGGGGGHGGGPGNLFAGESDEPVVLVLDPPRDSAVTATTAASASVRSSFSPVVTANDVVSDPRGESEAPEFGTELTTSGGVDPFARVFDYDAIRPIEV
jgi:Matrixin